jgi:hypothetical protein
VHVGSQITYFSSSGIDQVVISLLGMATTAVEQVKVTVGKVVYTIAVPPSGLILLASELRARADEVRYEYVWEKRLQYVRAEVFSDLDPWPGVNY